MLSIEIIQRTDKLYEIVQNKLKGDTNEGLLGTVFGEDTEENFLRCVRNNNEGEKKEKNDVLSDILRDVGVVYHHKNNEIVGDFELEQKITEHATEEL